jgi:hypothetical protein
MAGSHPEFRDVETLRDSSGVIIVVTERISNGRLSFALMNEFERDGITQRSAFLNSRHLDGATRLLAQLAGKLEIWEDAARARLRAAR